MTAPGAMLAWADLWLRFWDNAFYQQALLGGLAVALMCSVLSVFVVLKRMAFIGQGISHAAFGGFGAAVLAQALLPAMESVLARDLIVACFCVITALGIGCLSRRGKLSEDTAIGIAMVAAMALGVLLMERAAREPGYVPPPLHAVLFGDILFITQQEVWTVWIMAALIVAAVAAAFKELVFFAFDEEAARAFGVRTGLLYYGLLVALGLAVGAAMKTVGVILAGALLVLPGASARLWSIRVGWVTIISAVIGLGGLALGFVLSLGLEKFSTGPLIVLTLVAILAFSYAVRALRLALRRRRAGGRAKP